MLVPTYIIAILINYFNIINSRNNIYLFFQNKTNQEFLVPTSVEDHIKINVRLFGILNLNVEYNQNLNVLFATKNLLIINQ